MLTCLGCATGVTSDLDEGQGNEGPTGAGDAGQGAGGAGQGGSGHGAGGEAAGGGGASGCVPASEACDGLDNNCEGLVDEGFDCKPGGTQECFTGEPAQKSVGACKAGKQTCAPEGKWGECAGQVLPAKESCNGADDDCDGKTDEELGTTKCGVGLCEVTIENCKSGKPVSCTPGKPVAELCDGKDNDCDGQIDNGNPQGGQPCITGKPGVCGQGKMECVGGKGQCQQVGQSSPEKCDGQDNDCNGQTDEGNPGGGVSCSTGKPGPCDPGTMLCTGGKLTCQQSYSPVPEVCNDGKDNDCNGQVDDGCGCSHSKCQQGTPLKAQCGGCEAQICSADPYCCDTQWDGMCVDEVVTICNSLVCPASKGWCPHSLCEANGVVPFSWGCDSGQANCVSLVCIFDSYCCSIDWDSMCVQEVGSYCGLSCF
ncbi:MAG: hypothetical protein HY744_07435 [Deltaproteobacteria bacterium]|nr:hypothetical protein [Deltaproteobacteria bacterium]